MITMLVNSVTIEDELANL